MTLLSLTAEGVQLQKEAMIADDHFDVNYWQSSPSSPSLSSSPSSSSLSSSPSSPSPSSSSPSSDTAVFTPEVMDPLQDHQGELLTTSALPSTTLGVTAIKLHNARYLLYDTPGICPSAFRVRLLSAMMADEQSKVKVLFPRKRLVPTVFSLHPEHSILLGSLACIDYKTVENVGLFIIIFNHHHHHFQ